MANKVYVGVGVGSSNCPVVTLDAKTVSRASCTSPRSKQKYELRGCLVLCSKSAFVKVFTSGDHQISQKIW
jgi:hypothetical protein